MTYWCEFAGCNNESAGTLPVPSLIGGEVVELKGRFCESCLAKAKRLAEDERGRLVAAQAARSASAAPAHRPLPRQLG